MTTSDSPVESPEGTSAWWTDLQQTLQQQRFRQRPDLAIRALHEALPLAESTGAAHVGAVADQLAQAYDRLGQGEFSEWFRRVADRSGCVHLRAGCQAWLMSELPRASAEFGHALLSALATGNIVAEADAWQQLGQIALQQGNGEEAVDCFRQALRLQMDQKNQRALISLLWQLAAAWDCQGQHDQSLNVLRTAAELTEHPSLASFREEALRRLERSAQGVRGEE